MNDSQENVLKVVSPPANPTPITSSMVVARSARSARAFPGVTSSADHPMMPPRIKEPTMLTLRVAHGSRVRP